MPTTETPRLLRVAAYITAYQDAAALHRCLAGILAQSYPVDRVWIVDNSPTPLPLPPDCIHDARITSHHYPENIGIAGGLAQVVPWATATQFDALWLFDQDSCPAPDCLAQLVPVYDQYATPEQPVGLVAPTPVDARTGAIVQASRFLGDRFQGFPPPPGTAPYDCDAPITSGSLLWLGTVATVPPPDPDLIIDGVDLDYGWRLRLAGFRNLVVPTATLQHQFGTPLKTLHLLGRQKVLQAYSAQRRYYICRNQTYLELQFSQGWAKWRCGLHRLRLALGMSLTVVLFDPKEKWPKLWAIWQGTWHGLQGQLGKYEV